MVKDPETYWTVKDVAEYLGIKVQTVYNKVHTNTIPFQKIGLKSVRFKKDEIDSWIEASKKRAARKPEYVIKDGYPRRRFSSQSSYSDECYTTTQVAKEALRGYRHYAPNRLLYLGSRFDAKKEIEILLKNKIVVPELLVEGREYFSVFDESRLENLTIVAGVMAIDYEVSVNFYKTLMAAVRRNALKDFSFGPYTPLSAEEQSYYTEDLVGTILLNLKDVALGFATKDEKGPRSHYIDNYLDLASFLQAYALDYVYFSYDNTIDGRDDVNFLRLVVKERKLADLRLSYIETGLDEKFFLPDEILEPLEEHIKDLQNRVTGLKRIVRAIKKKK